MSEETEFRNTIGEFRIMITVKIKLTEEEAWGIKHYLLKQNNTIATNQDISDFIVDEIVRPHLHDAHNAVCDEVREMEIPEENRIKFLTEFAEKCPCVYF